MVQNNQVFRYKYWVTRCSVRWLAHTAHSFACFAHALHCAHLFARLFTHSRARGKVDDWMTISSVFFFSGPLCGGGVGIHSPLASSNFTRE